MVAPNGISEKAQILQDAEYHNRQKHIAVEAEFDKAFKHAAATGTLAEYMSKQLGISEFEFNFHNSDEDGKPDPRLTEAIELLRLIREDNFNMKEPEMMTFSKSTGIKFNEVKQTRMESQDTHQKRFRKLMDSL